MARAMAGSAGAAGRPGAPWAASETANSKEAGSRSSGRGIGVIVNLVGSLGVGVKKSSCGAMILDKCEDVWMRASGGDRTGRDVGASPA